MPDYLDLLGLIHRIARPATYLEIGVHRGDSLRLASAAETCVGVDPQPLVSAKDLPWCHLETTTSDEFFASARPSELFADRPVGLAFIDGMHLFEFALRDFAGCEALAARESLIVVHDCLPRDAETSSREKRTEHWTGDVWKLVLCLLDHRPNLTLSLLDFFPSGICLVRGLDPSDSTLRDNYQALVDEYLPLGFEEWQARFAEVVRRTMDTTDTRLWSLLADFENLQERLVVCATQNAALLASSSWRITAPLRRLGSLMGRHR